MTGLMTRDLKDILNFIILMIITGAEMRIDFDKLPEGINIPALVYILFMTVFFSWALFFIIASLRKVRNKRKKRLQNKKSEFLMHHDQQSKSDLRKIKQSGMESIESQFSISKKIGRFRLSCGRWHKIQLAKVKKNSIFETLFTSKPTGNLFDPLNTCIFSLKHAVVGL